MEERSLPFAILTKAWYNLRLSVRCPERVPTWDAIVVTASSPAQARLYQWQLDLAKRRGIIAPCSVAIAVPDPSGMRIGSGGATLHALRFLAHLCQQASSSQVSVPTPSSYEQPLNAEIISGMSVLLVHAGGDSKRVPWANSIGKAFLPLPCLIEDDPNEQASTLFDHILALSSHIAQDFKNQGGLFIMTGDVLPCYDFSHFATPREGACIVTVPAPPDVAANHGVILTLQRDAAMDFAVVSSQEHKLQQVIDLLQKPTHSKLLDSGALSADGTALLDSGIFVIRGKAWRDLLELAVDDPDPITELLEQKEEVSLYEEMAAAWVPSQHRWLESRPLGIRLLKALSSQSLFSYCAQNLSFLHFGTSVEVLAHLDKYSGVNNERRHMMLTADDLPLDIASSSLIISSKFDKFVFVGEQCLVCNCTLTSGVRIGNQCILLGIDSGLLPKNTHGPLPLFVPDQHCLWEVPLLGTEFRATLCCSIYDNAKLSISKQGTFCGNPWEKLLDELGVEEGDLWPKQDLDEEKNLWNAALFPVVAPGEGIAFAMWLMGSHQEKKNLVSQWRRCERVSYAELHGRINFQKLCSEFKSHQANVSLGLAKSSLEQGSLHRDLSKLCTQIVEGLEDGIEACRGLLTCCSAPGMTNFKVPQSRVYQAEVDLFNALEDGATASIYEKKVWEAVAMETAVAVGNHEVSSRLNKQLCCIFQGSRVKLELPARVDFAGGWSDTPPWSLEQTGMVLNMAICLEGCAPIGAELEVTMDRGVTITDDAGQHTCIKEPSNISPPYDIDDPFRLVKSALVVTDVMNSSALNHSGLAIRTWANVPRGSGLGTSSILAAAVVKGILQIMGANDSNEIVTSLVLCLEQVMGTGGGWQDQIGGLYPGIKCTFGFPGRQLLLKVESVMISSALQKELEEHLVIFFTGQVRSAHGVLQNVVRRYLQRDANLISTIKQLVQLAKKSQEAFGVGNLSELGEIMLDVWMLHQELDPFCSNAYVDMIFKNVHPYSSGYKLVGAGGGGFGLLMAKDREAAQCVKEVLKGLRVQVYEWKLHESI